MNPLSKIFIKLFLIFLRFLLNGLLFLLGACLSSGFFRLSPTRLCFFLLQLPRRRFFIFLWFSTNHLIIQMTNFFNHLLILYFPLIHFSLSFRLFTSICECALITLFFLFFFWFFYYYLVIVIWVKLFCNWFFLLFYCDIGLGRFFIFFLKSVLLLLSSAFCCEPALPFWPFLCQFDLFRAFNLHSRVALLA